MPPVARPSRPTLTAALLYAVLSVALVAPGLMPGHTLSGSDYLWSGAPWTATRPAGVEGLGGNYEQADAALVFQPFMQYTRAALPDVPLWNPHVMGGRPFVANAQSAVFSPFTWPALVLPFWWSLGVIAALKLFCAALGTYLLARALRTGFAGALLAGVTFAFSLAFVVWLSWPLSSVWAWMPWLFLGAWQVARRPGALSVAGLAAVVALQFFGGHPESSFHALAAASVFALLALSRTPPGARLRGAAALVGALVLGSALAAVAIVPFGELLLQSGDLTTREGRDFLTLHPRSLLGYAMPDYWGRPSGVVTDGFGFSVARAFYVGALPLMLAAWALVRPTRERVVVAGIAAASLAVVVGVPGFEHVAAALPGFDTAYNTRLIVVVALALSLLAGWGLGDLVSRVERPRLLVAGAVAVLVVPAVAVLVARAGDGVRLGEALEVAWLFADPPPMPAALEVVPFAALFVWLVLAGAAVALLALRASGRLGGERFAALAVALVVLDLFRIGMGINPGIPVDHAEQPVTPAIERLQAARPARFAGLQPDVGLQPLVPDLAMRYGLYDARGYDYPVERRYDRLWRRYVSGPQVFAPPTLQVEPTPVALRMLGLLGVTDLLVPPGGPQAAGLRATYDGPDARIYANPRAQPRTWVVGGQQRVASDDAALEAIAAPGFDPQRAAVVERPVSGLPDGPAAPAGTSSIASYERERVELDVRADRRGLVVLSDVHFPGWKATVDGSEVPVERVDYLLRGIPVDPGSHRVVLTYEPVSWRIGWVASLVALLILVGMVVASRRRGRLWESAARWPGRSSAR